MANNTIIIKKVLINFTFILFSSIFISTTSSNNFQEEYNKLVTTFQNGLSIEEEFDKIIEDFDDLCEDLEKEIEEDETIEYKDLLNKSQALYSFIGEISPDNRNFDLTNEKKKIALEILGLSESWFSKDKLCMDITLISIWNNTYSAFLVENNSECLETFTYTYNNGNGNASVDKYSSRSLYTAFGKNIVAAFKLTTFNCETSKYCN